jgi:hypothetical protein
MGDLTKYTVVLVASWRYDGGVRFATEYVQASNPELAVGAAEGKANLSGDSVDVAFICTGWHVDALAPQVTGVRINETTVVVDGVTYTREG